MCDKSAGVYTSGVSTTGEEAQDCWPGAKRPGNHHGYRTEGNTRPSEQGVMTQPLNVYRRLPNV